MLLVRASGESGLLRVGYQWAADLGAWSLQVAPRVPRTYAVRARVLRENAHWMRQEPLDLVLRLGNVEWTWRGAALRRDGLFVEAALSEAPIVEAAAPVVAARA